MNPLLELKNLINKPEISTSGKILKISNGLVFVKTNKGIKELPSLTQTPLRVGQTVALSDSGILGILQDDEVLQSFVV